MFLDQDKCTDSIVVRCIKVQIRKSDIHSGIRTKVAWKFMED